jgi:CheY-like chemotaxis protein
MRRSVLVVDDEVASGRALGRTLGARHDVTVLTGGEEAMRRIVHGGPFDVVLLDVMMPDAQAATGARLERPDDQRAGASMLMLWV